jgi:17beta-estradiol 17-dehydrogenase / very-long-chain 3-oxoacyl-CoA reductase
VDFNSIVKQLSDLHLTVVISNAGNGPTPTYGTLETYPQSMITSTVSLNALFPLHLVAHLLPTLLTNSPCLVIQIGSMSDNFLPLLASYSSSKAFIRGIFGCVAREMRLTNRTGVEMILMRVGRVTGVQHEDGKPNWTMPDAKVFARAALGWVGCGRSEVIPWWGHAFQQAFMVEVMPDWVREKVFLGVMRGLWEEQRAKGKRK